MKKGGETGWCRMHGRTLCSALLAVAAVPLLLGGAACQFPGNQCGQVVLLPDSLSVATLGDSIFVTNFQTCQNVPGYLSLLLGEEVQRYAVLGARLTNPTGYDVYDQYDSAGQENVELKTVVFTGGINDLFTECTSSEQPECLEDVQIIAAEIGVLLDRMVLDGRGPIVYVGYYEPTGSFENFARALHNLSEQAGPVCAERGCTFIDLRPVFATHPEWLADGVHPTPDGSRAIANEIFSALAGHCECTVWEDEECGSDSCDANLRQRQRTCAPAGCDLETECVADPACES